jgi:hypothetical protein
MWSWLEGEVLGMISPFQIILGVDLADLQENIRAGVIERLRAAEGFIYPSDPVRRERYTVIISGILQTIQNLNTLWTVLSLLPSPPFRVTLITCNINTDDYSH